METLYFCIFASPDMMYRITWPFHSNENGLFFQCITHFFFFLQVTKKKKSWWQTNRNKQRHKFTEITQFFGRFYETLWLMHFASFNENTSNLKCTLFENAATAADSGELLTNISTNVGAAKSESQYERDQSSIVALMFVAAAAAAAARCLNLLILFGLFCRLQGHVEKFTPN